MSEWSVNDGTIANGVGENDTVNVPFVYKGKGNWKEYPDHEICPRCGRIKGIKPPKGCKCKTGRGRRWRDSDS